MTPDITPISDILIPYNPRFATANYAPALKWLADGADMEHDILPVLRFWIGKKYDIYSLGFFTRYVRQARDARLNAPKPPEPVSIHEKARCIAFVTRRVGKCKPRDTAWLEAYEREYGRVELEDKSVAESAEA